MQWWIAIKWWWIAMVDCDKVVWWIAIKWWWVVVVDCDKVVVDCDGGLR